MMGGSVLSQALATLILGVIVAVISVKPLLDHHCPLRAGMLVAFAIYAAWSIVRVLLAVTTQAVR